MMTLVTPAESSTPIDEARAAGITEFHLLSRARQKRARGLFRHGSRAERSLERGG